MCTLYSHTTNVEAIRRLFKTNRDDLGNAEPQRAIFPDGIGTVVRVAEDGKREAIRMRWGFPKLNKPGATINVNMRNLDSSYWRPWQKPENRCLVPVTSFCEYDARTKNPKVPVWFAMSPERPLFAFAGVWRPWKGTRGTKDSPVEGEHLLYAFMTSTPNKLIAPYHPKAMPVCLTTAEEQDRWLRAPIDELESIQQPGPEDMLQVVASGLKFDPPEA